jgi:hypothetical protein
MGSSQSLRPGPNLVTTGPEPDLQHCSESSFAGAGIRCIPSSNKLWNASETKTGRTLTATSQRSSLPHGTAVLSQRNSKEAAHIARSNCLAYAHVVKQCKLFRDDIRNSRHFKSFIWSYRAGPLETYAITVTKLEHKRLETSFS